MNYRRIRPKPGNSNKGLEPILYQIAEYYNQLPGTLSADNEASAKDIEETVQKIRNTKNEDLFITIAEDHQGQIQGFIWAYKQEKPQNSVMILSLYISDSFRGKGLASHLNNLLEEWCRQEGITTIQTTAYYDNHGMIALNQKLGYIPNMVSMTKRL